MCRPSIRPNWRLTLVLILLLLSSFACTAQPEPLARVGERTITAEDVAYRQAAVAARSGEAFPAHLALLQLIEEALMAEVSRTYGVVVSEEMLAEEAERVQETSRDPETLARIRAVFDDDEDAYRRLVLEPILVNQLLYARFSLGHDIQAEPLARAKEVLDAAHADPTSLSDMAEAFGGDYRHPEVIGGHIRSEEETDEDEIIPELAPYDLEWPDYDSEFVEKVVAGLTVGELHPKVVEDRRSFMVVRLLSRDGDYALLESVVIAKLAFDPWFHTQSQLVPLTIRDQALKEALLADVDLPYITDRLSDDE